MIRIQSGTGFYRWWRTSFGVAGHRHQAVATPWCRSRREPANVFVVCRPTDLTRDSSNAYSEAGLNFCSKAAQNIHVLTPGTIDGMKVDLQDVTGIDPYTFNRDWEAYCPKSERKLHTPSVVYQVVV